MLLHSACLQGSQGKATQAGTQRRGCLEGLFFTLAALKVEGEDEQYSRKVSSYQALRGEQHILLPPDIFDGQLDPSGGMY